MVIIDLNGLPSPDRFVDRQPYPWVELPDALSPAHFDELNKTFPDLDLFERHVNRPRPDGQRPHNRHYLAFEQSPHGQSDEGQAGVIGLSGLDESWRRFIDQLRSPAYLDAIREMLRVDELVVRFAWHVGTRGSEVSPHRDAAVKLGTHLFYFNTETDWQARWGGATELLGAKRGNAGNPDFEDFDERVAVPNVATSLLFANRPHAWHGVRTLDCPPHAQRRLFTVVFDQPRRNGLRRLMSRAADRLGR